MSADGARRIVTSLPALIASAVILAAAGQAPQPASTFDAPLDRALKRHVHDGLVDYAGMKSDVDLAAAVAALAVLDPCTLGSNTERLACWINAYNALVIRGVVENHPIGSVTDVGLPGRWSFFRINEFLIGGKPHTLDRIEHEIIRPVFRDPRVHFALVCGALGCPRLRAGAWRADRLETDLDDAARAFINDPAKVDVRADLKVLRLSRIFEWYRDDFMEAAGSIEAYIGRYRTGAPIPADLRIEYIDYSWALNDVKAVPARGRP